MLSFVGRIIRLKEDRVTARLTSTFNYTKRPVEKPNNSVRHYLVSDNKKMFSFVDNQGSFSTWAYIMYDELI